MCTFRRHLASAIYECSLLAYTHTHIHICIAFTRKSNLKQQVSLWQPMTSQSTSHTHTVARETVVRVTMKAYGGNLTPATQKPLNQSLPKFAYVITSAIPADMQNFIEMDKRFHFCTYTIMCTPFVSAIFKNVFWFFQSPTAKTCAPIFHAKYAKRRDSAHGCVFWGLQNQYLKFYSPFTPKTANFGADFHIIAFFG